MWGESSCPRGNKDGWPGQGVTRELGARLWGSAVGKAWGRPTAFISRETWGWPLHCHGAVPMGAGGAEDIPVLGQGAGQGREGLGLNLKTLRLFRMNVPKHLYIRTLGQPSWNSAPQESCGLTQLVFLCSLPVNHSSHQKDSVLFVTSWPAKHKTVPVTLTVEKRKILYMILHVMHKLITK